MEGLFNIAVLDAKGFTDEDFRVMRREGRLQEQLQRLPVVQQAQTKNRIFDNMAGYLLDRVFSLPACASYYSSEDYGPSAALSFIVPLTTDAATSDYVEDWTAQDRYPRAVDDIVVAADASVKRFIEDEITANVIWVDADREAIHFRTRWLYLPSEIVSSNIRSIGIFFQSDGNNVGGGYREVGRLGRVRLKNSGGVPVVLNKTAAQVLLIEYTFTLVSV